MDLQSVLEEVALEGLDGITLNALWFRIANRPDNNPGSLDDYVKEYVWKNLVCCRELEFFKLSKPRPDLVITDFSENIHRSRRQMNEYPVDIYSIEKVEQDGIIGCCDDFKTRISIIHEIRGEDDTVLMTVKEANDKWGQHLVIVASQALRFQVLFGTNYLPSGVGAEAYCLMERIGRSRYNGDITLPMPSGRGVLNKYLKSSNLFSLAKYLCYRGFMRKQPYNIRFPILGRVFHVRLLHLSRFYTESNANFLKCLETMCHTLKEAPDKRLPKQEMLKILGVAEEDVRKHWTIISKFIDREMIDYRKMYPEATEKEYLAKNRKERKVGIYSLIKPFSYRSRKELEDEDDDEEDDEIETEEADKETSEKQLQPGTGPLYEMTFPKSLQYIVDKAGPKGISVNRITRIFGLHKKNLFRALTSLFKLKLIVNVAITSKTSNSHILVSARHYKEKPDIVVKSEPMEVDDSVETTQQFEGEDSAIQDLASGSKAIDKNVNDEEIEDEELENDTALDMDEEVLDQTLADLELEWTLEKDPEPKEMSSELYQQMAWKKKRRRHLIMRYLEKNRVCVSQFDLRKKIINSEAKQGIKEEMCRKSFNRIVDEMCHEGKLCQIVIHCKKHAMSPAQKLVAVYDIDASERAVKEAIILFHTTKYKFYVSLNKTRELRLKKLSELTQGEEQLFSYTNTLTRLSKTKEAKPVNKPIDPQKKNYDRLAKITKAKELHTFMFYLLYDYPESARVVKHEAGPSSLDSSSSQLNESTNLPVYMDVDDWRRHVPPLKIHNSKYLKMPKVDGICMLGDLLMAMPVCMLCRVISCDWPVEGLSEILKDPKKRLQPLYTMPAGTLRDLCRKRNYIRKIIDTFNLLCRMGLASYGTNTGLRALEYTVFYLHTKGMLLDTMKSLPGHTMTNIPPPDTEFPSIHFQFEKMSDLDVYWKEAQLICMATPLGHLDPPDVPGFHGEIAVVDAIKPRPIDEIKEDNWLPGDRRGAGGFDSSMFMHIIRSWDFKKFVNKPNARGVVIHKEKPIKRGRKPAPKPVKTAKKAVKRARESLASMPRPPKKKKKNSQKDTEKKKEVQKEESEKSGKARKTKFVLDEEDKKAKMEMARMRCLFTPFENGIFLLCHVVSHLFNPKDLRLRLTAPDMRTIFRSMAPEASKDKTTHAIKGKSARLIRDQNFLCHLGVYLAKTRYDLKLMEEYKDFKYSQSPKYRRHMVETFHSLVKKLHVKFSTREQTLPYDLPQTTSEFHRRYEVHLSLDLKKLRETASPSAFFDISNPFDVRACVLWDFILGWMHSNKTVCNILVYHVLCKYSEEAVNKTHNLLKNCRVMYMHKKYSYNHGQRIVSRTDQMVSNLILSKRHREKLGCHYPAELFLNGLKQMNEWNKHFEKTHHLYTLSNETGDKDEDGDASHTKRLDDATVSQGCSTSSGDTSTQDSTQDRIPTEDGTRDRTPVEKILIPLDVEKLQGGSLITLLPLMALDLLDVDFRFPDNMVKLSQEGVEQLTSKKQDRKRKAKDAALDTSLEDSNEDDEEDAEPKNWKSLRKPIVRKKPRYSGQSPMKKTDADNINDDPENDSQPSLSQPPLSQVRFGNVNIRFSKEGRSYGDVLTDFTLSFASGTLLALARTHMLADIDLLNTHINVQRFFVVDPLVMKFALKKCYVDDNDGIPKPYPDSNDDVGKERRVNNEKEKNQEKSSDIIEASSSSSSAELSQNTAESSARSISSSVAGNQIEKNAEKETGAKSVCKNKGVKNGVSAFYRPDVYAKIMSRLEKSFPDDYAHCDVHQELDSVSEEGGVDSGWVEQGRSLFSMIDSCGPNGVTESDMEKKLDKPIGTLQSLLDKLCDMNAVHTTVTKECMGEDY